MNFTAASTALAARFAPAQVTPPAGYDNVRLSTDALPDQLPPTPCVLVFPPEQGRADTGTGTRLLTWTHRVRFYYDQYGDLPRHTPALIAWLGVLASQLLTGMQLGSTVARATVDEFTVGRLTYGQQDYSGIELVVRLVGSESWSPTA